MSTRTDISIGLLCFACLTPSLHADAPPVEPAETAVSPGPATFDVRVVQLDMARIADETGPEGDTIGIPESWGVSFGFRFDGALRIKPPVFFLGDDGALRIGRRVWRLGAALDDAERGIERPGSPFQVLSAPRVQCRAGDEAVISIGSPVDYLLRDERGCLRPADGERDPMETEGVVIRLRPTQITDEAVEFDPVEVRLRRVVRREAIEGVPMDVGRPVMREDHLERGFRLVGDDVAVMLLSRMDEGTDGPIFVVVSRAD